MNPTKLKLSALGVVVACGTAVFVWQHRINAALRDDLVELRRQNRDLRTLRGGNPPTQEPQVQAGSADSNQVVRTDLIRARSEVAELEKNVEAAQARATAAANRDPEKGLVRLKYFRNVGRATPAAAYQTLFWAVLNGDDDVLAGALALSASSRQKIAELLAKLPAEARAKTPTPEKLCALLFAREIMLTEGSAQVLGQTMQDAGHATLQLRLLKLNEEISEVSGPMVLGDGGWQLVLPEHTSNMVEEALTGTSHPRTVEP